MLEKVKITNFKNETLEVELKHPELSGLCIYNIEGIGGAKGVINTSDMATGDGAWYNSAKAEKRNIVIYAKILPFPTIEQTRHDILYKYFPLKKNIRLDFITDQRVMYIEGYVESNETPIFSNQEYSTISIICPDPFFYSTGAPNTKMAGTQPMFEFPFEDDCVIPTPESDPYNPNFVDNFDFYHIVNTGGKTTYTGTGPTIRSWYFENPSEGNASVVVGLTYMKVNQYVSNSQPIRWYNDFGSLTKDSTYTATYLDALGLHSITFTVDRTSYNLAFVKEFPTSTDNVKIQIASDANTRTYKFQIYMPAGVDATFELNAVKVEEGKSQTLAKVEGSGYILIEPPVPSNNVGPHTLEFGDIIIDSRAIIDYHGSVDSGIDIQIAISGPVNDITIYYVSTGEQFKILTTKAAQIIGSVLQADDIMHIITTRGHKRVYVLRDNVEYDITGAVDKSSTWFQLTAGENIFDFNAETGLENLTVTFIYSDAYQGV